MLRKLKIAAIVVLSTGWLVPAYICLRTATTWLDTDVSDHLRHVDPQYTTQFTLQIMQWSDVAFAWFACAVLFWSVAGAVRLLRK